MRMRCSIIMSANAVLVSRAETRDSLECTPGHPSSGWRNFRSAGKGSSEQDVCKLIDHDGRYCREDEHHGGTGRASISRSGFPGAGRPAWRRREWESHLENQQGEGGGRSQEGATSGRCFRRERPRSRWCFLWLTAPVSSATSAGQGRPINLPKGSSSIPTRARKLVSVSRSSTPESRPTPKPLWMQIKSPSRLFWRKPTEVVPDEQGNRPGVGNMGDGQLSR